MEAKKMNKCKAPGCSKWVLSKNASDFCLDHQGRVDPLSALYIDKSPEEIESDNRVVEFFSYLLHHRKLSDLLY